MENRAVRPVFVSMLATMMVSGRVPVRSAPSSWPSSRMFTRSLSAHGSSPGLNVFTSLEKESLLSRLFAATSEWAACVAGSRITIAST